MKIAHKRCTYCRRWYEPDARTARFQKSCARKECQSSRQRRKYREWISRNPGYNLYRKSKIRDWARNYPHYWQGWRAAHPDYVRRDKRRRVLARKKRQLSAKQTAIGQIIVEKLKTIRQIRPPLSAKQTAIDRRVDGLIELLIWKEMSAKQMPIASLTGSVP